MCFCDCYWFGVTSLTLALALLHVLLICRMGHFLPSGQLLVFDFDGTQRLAFRFMNFHLCVLCTSKQIVT